MPDAWISVKDRLPESRAPSLVMEEGYETPCVAYYDKSWDSWFEMVVGLSLKKPVTHWMPLPEPPKE